MDIVISKNNNITKNKKLSLLVLSLIELLYENNKNININDIIHNIDFIDKDITDLKYNDLKKLIKNHLISYNNIQLSDIKKSIYNINYDQLELLGKGSYGHVYKVFHKLDEQFYAIKKVFIKDIKDINEIKLLSKLNHKYIVKYCNSWIDTDTESIIDYNNDIDFDEDVKLNNDNPILFIQMELCDKNFYDIIKDFNININQKLFYYYQILLGIQYLHHNNIMHRDIKPSNILLKKLNKNKEYNENNKYKIKIGDLGMAKLYNNKQLIMYTDNNENRNNSVEIGSIIYNAPEIESGNYDNKIDIYSLGVLLIEILLDYSKIKTISEKFRIINNIKYNNEYENMITDKYNEIIKNCINIDCNKRYNIDELISNFKTIINE